MSEVKSKPVSRAAQCSTAEPMPEEARETSAAAFDRCSVALYRYLAARTGNDRHLADDLMQQLWIHAQSLDGDTPAGQIEFRLRAVARNLVRAHWRRVGHRPQHLPLADPSLAAELSRRLSTEELPSAVLQRREVRDQLVLALTELPATQQQLIVEHYFEGRPQADIARRTGTSTRAVEGRLYRARLALRERLRHLEPF